MISLFGNCNGVGGVIGSQLYVTTQKVGSTILRATSLPEYFFFFDQDNVVQLIREYTSKTGINNDVCLILRDPEERVYSGAAQNSLILYSNSNLNSNSYPFERDIHFSNSKKLLAYRNFALAHVNNWVKKGVPIEHEDVVRNLIKLYLTKTVNRDIYFDPHVMPFYTCMYKLLTQHSITFHTCFLEDIDFKVSSKNMKGNRHSNGNFRNIIREVYESIDNDFLKDMIKKEKQTVEHLKTFFSKPQSELI